MADKENNTEDVDPTDVALPEENVDLVLSEAHRRVLSTISSYDQLHTKAGVLLAFVAGFSTVMATFSSTLLLVPYLTCSVISAIYALAAIQPQDIAVDGYDPTKLFQNKLLRQPSKELKARLVRRYGQKVAHNHAINESAAEHLSLATRWFVTGTGIYLSASLFKAIWLWIVSTVG